MPIVPVLDDNNRNVITASPFAINTDYEVKATGFKGLAPAGQTTDIDFPIGKEDRYLSGLQLILKNQTADDFADLRVMDKDGVLAGIAYPPNTPLPVELRHFGNSWNVCDDKSDQGLIVINFLAKIFAGLYVRITYTSVGLLDVKVNLNLMLQKKIS